MLANITAQISAFVDNYGAVSVLIVVLAIGVWRIITRLIGAKRRERLTDTFRDRFQAYAESSGEDTEAYERLAFYAGRMADAMGPHAAVDATPPFAGRSAKKYVTVLQFIPELRMHFSDLRAGGYGLGNEGASWIYHIIDDALIRYLGALDATVKSSARRLFNPIAWLAEGAERILALPFYVLGWFGLREAGSAAALEQNMGFRAVAGIAALIVVGTVISIFMIGEQRTATAYRNAATTTARAVDSGVTAIVSAFVDVGKAVVGSAEESGQQSGQGR